MEQSFISHKAKAFIAPGLNTLANLIKSELVFHGLDLEAFDSINIIEWLSRQNLLDFGSNKGKFFARSLSNMGNNDVDALYFNESKIHSSNSEILGLKVWSEIASRSKRIAVGVLAGNSFNKLPKDLVNMEIDDYDDFMKKLLSKITNNALIIIDSQTLNENELLKVCQKHNLEIKKSGLNLIISELDQKFIFDEILSELHLHYNTKTFQSYHKIFTINEEYRPLSIFI